MYKRVIPRNEIVEQYPDLPPFLDALAIYDAVVVEDPDNKWRFRPNNVTREFYEAAKPRLDLDKLASKEHLFRVREIVLFYVGLGYSICGFYDIFDETISRVLGIVRDDNNKEIRREPLIDNSFVDELLPVLKSQAESAQWKDPAICPPKPYLDYVVVVCKDYCSEGVGYEIGKGHFLPADKEKFPGHGEFDKDRWLVNGRVIIVSEKSKLTVRYCEIPM
jgi:hypothetical protein